jgi:hypothetical protein
VQKVQSEAGVLVVHDLIAHKPFNAINGLVYSHYDHSFGE